jgi:hypothetical protein
VVVVVVEEEGVPARQPVHPLQLNSKPSPGSYHPVMVPANNPVFQQHLKLRRRQREMPLRSKRKQRD